jgi:DNA-binding NarL/FixJ family response regulator
MRKIRVTILDDHPITVDGYRFRLGNLPDIEIVAALRFGEELLPALEKHPTDVLLLDFSVPVSATNPNIYPTLTEIPRLLQLYPNLDVLMISMYSERSIIRAVMEAGASGFILKDDSQAIENLANVVRSLADGGIYLSQRAGELYAKHTGHSDTNLTRRQLEALLLCAAFPSSTTAELAQKLCVSNSTVRNLLSGAYLKLNAHTRAAALEKARRMGLLNSDIPTIPRG